MLIKSFIKSCDQLEPIDVEVILLPGLPQIHFLGQADSSIKESSHRIRSAIKNSGFQFPVAQQILVDLRPHEIKKKSVGIEFAVAYGILCETGQIETPLPNEKFFVYGELGLNGEVYTPQDLESFYTDEDLVILTGYDKTCQHLHKRMVNNLENIRSPQIHVGQNQLFQKLKRPTEGLINTYSEEEARVLEILALGEHTMMIAGPAGAGKTTLFKNLRSFLEEPKHLNLRDQQFIYNVEKSGWRPFLKPHFSSTTTSLIGGGDPLQVGDLTRAHGGVLLLDEFLEFSIGLQEALRTPMEDKKIVLSRGRQTREFPCHTLVAATTNLCPCGKWVPNKPISCHHSLRRCRSVIDRLSGPILDRFEILYFKTKYEDRTVVGYDILKKVEAAREFRKQFAGQKAENRLQNPRLFDSLFTQSQWSMRRKNACLSVAQTLADLSASEIISTEHVEEAFNWSCQSFLKLQSIHC